MRNNVIIRTILFLCALFGCVQVLFAYNNNAQKIYGTDSELYEAVNFLYLSEGRTEAFNSGPWSADELNKMLLSLDYASLNKTQKNIYDRVKSKLNLKSEIKESEYNYTLMHSGDVPKIVDLKVVQKEKADIFRFSLSAAFEMYTHTNTNKQFVGKNSWNYNFLKQKPLVGLSLEFFPGDNFYTFFELTIGNYLHTQFSEFGDKHFHTNILGLQDVTRFNLNDMDLNIPYRAFIAAGGEHWSIQLGRDRLSWGPGVVSNFVVGDNLKYHNMLRAAVYYDEFKYTFLLSFFPHPQNYATSKTHYTWGVSPNHQYDVFNGINMFMAHRIEWKLFNDKFKIALTEGVMYQSATNFIDLQILNPVMFFHDLYMRSNANSILSLELEYSPIKSLNIYTSIVCDEIAGFGESKPGVAANANPNALGYMLGVKYVNPIHRGIFYSSVEGTFTDPYLYLRDAGMENSGDAVHDQKEGEYGINYVVAFRNLTPSSIVYDEEFLGYKFGGDAIVCNINAGYKIYDEWNVEGNLFYMAHGTHDKWTCWNRVTPSTYEGTPTSTHHSENHKGDVSSRNAVAHYFVLGLCASYNFFDNLKVNMQFDAVNIWNAANIAGAYLFDAQLTMGLTYTLDL